MTEFHEFIKEAPNFNEMGHEELVAYAYAMFAAGTKADSENTKLQQELAIRQESEQEKVIEYLQQENVDWEDKYRSIAAENAKLQELALGLKWCSENYGCENLCPLYDKSESEHCREERLLRELGIEAKQ